MTAERCRCARCDVLEAIRERLSARHCALLDTFGKFKADFVRQVLAGSCTVDDAGEAIGRFIDLSEKHLAGEVTREQAAELVVDLALRHAFGDKPS